MTSVRAIADRVAMIHEGEIRWQGAVGDRRPGPAYHFVFKKELNLGGVRPATTGSGPKSMFALDLVEPRWAAARGRQATAGRGGA